MKNSLCTAVIAFLTMQLIAARPTATTIYHAEDMIIDADSLGNLMGLCSRRPDLCVKGGRVEGVTERKLHKLGMTRLQSHIALQVLRLCLDDLSACDKEKTVSAMKKIRQLSKDSRIDGKALKLKRGYMRSYIPQNTRHHGELSLDGFKGSYMFGRVGKSQKNRVRRSFGLYIFNEVVREVCDHGRRCDEGKKPPVSTPDSASM